MAMIAVASVCIAASFLASAQRPAEKTVSDSSVATNTTNAQVTSTGDADDRYRIGPGDVLDIRILNRP